MPGPTASRARRALRLLAAIQVFLLLASLFAPIPIAAADPSPDPSAPAASAVASPPATPESTPDPSPVPTPDTSPTPAPEATSAPTAAPTKAPTAAPTISSDKGDYAPGELVTLAGSNWHAGESVHISVNDSAGSTWSRSVDVVADAGGDISDHFNLPNWFVATYSVLATGAVSGTAVTTFTDAIATSLFLIDSVSPSVFGQSVTFTATVTYFGSGGGHNSGDPVTEGTVVFGEDGNNNCGGGGFILLQSAQTPNASGQVTFTTSTLAAGTHDIHACYNGTGGSTGTSNSSSALTLVVNACSAPAITTQPTGQSITYGANATFTAAASGSPVPTAQWQVSTNSGATWNPVTGATSASLTLTQPSVAQSGNQYRAVFTNSCGGTSTATTNAATLTVAAKPVTITPDNGQSKVYGGIDPALTYTYSALVGSDTNSVFTGALGRASGEGVGTYVINLGSLNGAPNYALVLAATPVNFTIGRAHLLVNAVAASKTYGNTDPTFSYTLSGFVNGEDATSALVTGSALCTRTAGDTVAGSPYTITCTPGTLAAPNYDFATGTTAIFTIGRAHLLVNAVAASKTYGDPDPAFSYTLSGFVNSETAATALVTGSASCTRTAGESVAGSPYIITCTPGTLAAPNYDFATGTSASFTINAATLSVNAVANSKTYGEADPSFGYVLTGFQFSDDASNSGITGTASCTRIAGESVAGSPYLITCTPGTLAAPNYVFVTGTTANFTIGPATLSVNAVANSKIYGDPDPAFTYTLSGFVNGENATTALVTGSASCTRAAGESVAGSPYIITCTPGTLAAPNYVFVTGTTANFTIGPALLTVTANNNSKDYDGSPFSAFTRTITGFKFSDTEAVISGTVTYTGSAVGAINAGNYTITPVVTGLSADNYSFTPVSGTLTIAKVALLVTADNKSKVFDGNPFTAFTRTITGFVNGETESVVTGTVTYSGSAVGATAVGTYTITPVVSALSATNYTFTPVNGTLTIGAWTAIGFYQPVGTDNSIFTAAPAAAPGTKPSTIEWNTVKGGSTVPLKFNAFANAVERTSLADIKAFTQQKLPSCTDSSSEDPVDVTTTGGTTLRYDLTGHQWIQNWQTPKVSSDTCYRAWVTFADNSSIEAFFKLKR